MKKFEQIIKFGIVGVLAFLIDAGLLYALVRFLYWNAVPASIVSFIVSLIFNYLASMKYVFVHRDDMARWMEIVIFVVSSVIGLLINAFIIWIGTAVIISPSMQQTDPLWYQVYTMGRQQWSWYGISLSASGFWMRPHRVLKSTRILLRTGSGNGL